PADQGYGDARLARRARTRRDDDPVGSQPRDLVERDRVVPADVDLGAELPKVLDEVVGEGIVVVDHQQAFRRGFACQPLRQAFAARHPNASAMRMAWIRARALLMHSRCSASGSESATIPAPDCTNTRPLRKSALRMVIAVSIAPEKSK